MAIKHSTIKAAGQKLFAVADWNADHVGTAQPTNHGNEAHTSAFITGAQVPANETDPVYTAERGNYLKKDGSVALTGNWDAGSFQIQAETLKSDVATGTIPVQVTSSTKCTNLNADLLDGNEAAAFATAAAYNAHDHSAADPTQVSHADLTNVSSDQHHARSHSLVSSNDHTSAVAANKHFKADANGLPVEASNTDAEISGAVSASHAKQHAITSTLDHTSAATPAQILKADANGLPVNATNTDAEVSDAVAKRHAEVHTHVLAAGATDVTATAAQLNYLNAATGTTGTTNTNVVFSTSPTLTTPAIGAATATSVAIGANTLDTNEWAALDGVDAAWSSYTPTWSHITEGNGTSTGAYKTIGKMVFFRASFTLGTTSSVDGVVSVSLPVAKETYTGNIGIGFVYDSSAGTACPVMVNQAGAIRTFKVDATYATHLAANVSVPFTWDTGDSINIQGFYEAD